MLIVELLIDVGDAMGANVTNLMCEAAAPLVEEATGGTALLKILSNTPPAGWSGHLRSLTGRAVGGAQVVDGIIDAYQFARHDVHRAVTHNKGVMNGIVAVAAATGQDGRAIEAAAHAYAAGTEPTGPSPSGPETGTETWWEGWEVPMAVGTVGGIVNVHP